MRMACRNLGNSVFSSLVQKVRASQGLALVQYSLAMGGLKLKDLLFVHTVNTQNALLTSDVATIKF